MSNATVTVAYEGREVVITLDGTELCGVSGDHLYLANSSKGFISDEVEQALIEVSA